MREITSEDLKVVFLTLLRNNLLIFLFTVAGLCVGLLYFARQPVTYTYSATSTVSVVFDTGVNVGPFTGIGVISNFAEIVTSDRIAEYAAELIAGEGITAREIQEMITTNFGAGSPILNINAQNSSPRLVILVANAVAESFVSQIAVITGVQSIQMLDPASSAYLSMSQDSRIFKMLAPVVAFILACILVVVIEPVSGKVRTVKQCVDDMGELMAVIPKVSRMK